MGMGASAGADTGLDSTGAPVVDVGTPPVTGGSACVGKIDIIFVANRVDGQNLLESIPEFTATMMDQLSEYDLHVMVVDPDGEWGDSLICPKNKCPADGGCPAEGYESFPCWALHDEDALDKCDNTRGAGLVFPAGYEAANKPCGVPPGQRFISRDSPAFGEVFECLLRGSRSGGGHTQFGRTMGRALAFDLQHGCNSGFLREDALLLSVMISEHNFDDTSPGEWAEDVLEAKDHDQNMVVALAITTEWQGYEPKVLCDGGLPTRKGMNKWVQYFENSVLGSRCAPTYGPFFAEAAKLAADLCEPIPR